MAFEGFSRDGVKFFRELAARQDREWFKEHKAEFQALWEQPMKELLQEIGPKIAKQYEGHALDQPKQFRIYRDVRFSKDKSPFKTNVAGMIGFQGGGDEGAPAAIYFHFGLEDVAGAGHWMLPGDKLQKFRQLVADEKTGRELQKRVDTVRKKGFEVDAFEKLKRVPPGFDPEHPRAELLKQKGLSATFPKVPASVRFSPKLAGWLVDRSAEVSTLVGWLEEQLS